MGSARNSKITPTGSHWGNYRVEAADGELLAIHHYPQDEYPSGIGQSLLDTRDPNVRIAQPMVRRGYLEQGPDSDRSLRGKEPFVAVSWEEALDLAAGAIDKVKQTHGNEAIYGGSYGWASAGRFHHAQSQIHRFLKMAGGYVDCRDDYSCAAAHVIVPHVLGRTFYEWAFEPQGIEDIIEHSESMVLFGGAALKNTEVNVGGLGGHNAARKLREVYEAGVKVYNISPLRDDVAVEAGATWISCVPNSDTALMLGIAHTLVEESLHDQAFIDRYCEGWGKFKAYLLGDADGQARDAEWASTLCGVQAEEIRALARVMASGRCVIGVSWSLQRQQHGEQPYWMATVLAAMLGYVGLPGGGITYGYGCVHNIGFGGRGLPPFSMGAFPQGENPVSAFIPVARIADMLLHPGESFQYNGQSLVYPDIRLVYWAGGNPFHHHQDLHRLRLAWQKPETIIVNEPFWTATARHADIVFPVTTTLERDDIGGGSYDSYVSPMPRAVGPYASARDDYQIFAGLAQRLGFEEAFTEGRDAMEWLQEMYRVSRENAAAIDVTLPEWEDFWAGEQFDLRDQFPEKVWCLEKFRQDPDSFPLTTPSGKIEISSTTIESFGYDDCGAHPKWFDKDEWLGAPLAERYPLHMISNQPKKKLHSQLDFARNSRDAKQHGREIIRMHPEDAAQRQLEDGNIVRVYNDRGACLAAVELTDSIRPRVVELPTGAWFDPENPQNDGGLEVHGNPNVLTRDRGTSQLAQGPSAHSCLVEVEAFTGELPPIKVFSLPAIEYRRK